MDVNIQPIPDLAKQKTSTYNKVRIQLNLDSQESLDEFLTSLKSIMPHPEQIDNSLPSNLRLLALLLEEHEEIRRLKYKVECLEERLLMEISGVPPRFIPP